MRDIHIDDQRYSVPDKVAELFQSMVAEINGLRTFKEVVADMRNKQKMYFKTRATNILDDSKAVEHRVDDILSGKSEAQKQTSLF